jgi:sortase A
MGGLMRRKVASALSLLLLAVGGAQGWQGVWIYLKAELAQVLLSRAWERTMAGEERVRPWPWADAWPVAKIILPEESYVVLAGASGRNLAFAPGHLHGSAQPGAEGSCVIAGHRDTHFAGLADLSGGDVVRLELSSGEVYRYRVTSTTVVDQRDTGVLADGPQPLLVLITCWPFDAVVPGGPLRFVVLAELV